VKLLYIVHQFMPEYTTGTEAVAFRLAKAAQRSGHSVTVLTCSTESDSLWSGKTPEGLRWRSVRGVPVYALAAALVSDPYGFAPGVDVEARVIFSKFVANGEFDLVHVMHSMRMLDAIDVIKELGIPYVITLTDFFTICYRINHIRASGELCPGSSGGEACEASCKIVNVRMDKRQRWLRAILANATERIACSQFVKEQFEHECPNLAFRVIPHGIDLLRFSPREFNNDTDEIVFGFLGTLSEAKGIDTLVNAFLDSGVVNGKLVIVGPVHDNLDVESRIKSACERDRRIILKRPVSVDEVPSVLSGFDILCVPSQVPETFSLALHEGFAAGLPAIVSDLGHIAQVVSATGCGLVVPATSLTAWSDAIKSVAANRNQLRIWQTKIPCPLRIEEEAFFYDQIYRRSLTRSIDSKSESDQIRARSSLQAERNGPVATVAPSRSRGILRRFVGRSKVRI
jgi:glycosyltransferase involved in cell wall biosynthesis